VTITSLTTPEFWRLYRQLPGDVRQLARHTYQIWQRNPFHPSLHFKKLRQDFWSVRIGIHYRAIGSFHGSQFIWTWIGSHADYDQIM
jgi:hypothetical protein